MKNLLFLLCILLICMLPGCSDDSGSAPVKKPGTPVGLSVDATGLTSLTLSWDTVNDATGYKLYRSTSVDGIYTEVYSGAAAGFLDEGLAYAATYYYEVTARNSGGESDPSAPVDGRTDIPAGFTVTGSPGGGVDYTFNHYDEYNGHPRYQSTPVGLWIVVPTSGAQAGHWAFYDQIETIYYYYHEAITDYPPPTGWKAVVGGASTSILLTPF